MKHRTYSIYTLLLCALITSACGDLTFENKGNVDFERFQSVFVMPIQIEGIYAFSNADQTGEAYDYFVNELQSESGFREVVSTLGDATDTDLNVWISVREDYNYDTDTITYYAQTKFLLSDQRGLALYTGQASDSGDDLESVVFETLAEVAHFFIQPYRI